VATNAELSGEAARRESEPALISPQFFSTPESAGKNKSINFIGSMNFESTDLSGKNVNLFS